MIAKQASAPYKPGERMGMVKIKRVRTADAVVAAFRFGKEADTVGSLILGLYDEDGELHIVGHTSGFRAKEKRELLELLEPYRTGERGSGGPSRWKSDEELVWEGLRPELVCEIAFDHITGQRIRHGAKFLRWRTDKEPRECVARSIARLTLAAARARGRAGAGRAGASTRSRPTTPSSGRAGARGEIYVYGMRNPYRWSFDRLDGDMWIGDVGGHPQRGDRPPPARPDRRREPGLELPVGQRERRRGCTPANYVAPVHDLPERPDVVIGGYVVRDPSLPAFAGRYLFGRLNSGIYRLEANGSRAPGLLDVTAVSGFGEDGAGQLYVTSLNGAVYRLGQSGSTLTTTSIGSFTQPLAVAAAPGDAERLFVVEKTGEVRVRTGGQVSEFLDIASLVATAGGEQGLLAFAVAPDYATSGRVFAYYTDNGDDLQLDEFRRTADGPDRADPARAGRSSRSSTTRPRTTTAGSCCSGATARSTCRPATAAPRATRRATRRASARCSARCCASTSASARRGPSTTVAPALRTKVKRRQRVLRLRGAVAYARCSESCAVIAAGRLRVGGRARTG